LLGVSEERHVLGLCQLRHVGEAGSGRLDVARGIPFHHVFRHGPTLCSAGKRVSDGAHLACRGRFLPDLAALDHSSATICRSSLANACSNVIVYREWSQYDNRSRAPGSCHHRRDELAAFPVETGKDDLPPEPQ